MDANSRSDSSSVSAELGSSNRKKRRVLRQRPGDLDALADRQRAFGQQPVRVALDLELAQDREVGRGQARERDRPRLAADHHVLGDREVGPQLRLLVDDRHAVARVAGRPWRAVQRRSRPPSRTSSPARIRTSVLLPAPLGPAMPRISPDRIVQVHALEGPRLAERLADAAQLHRDRARTVDRRGTAGRPRAAVVIGPSRAPARWAMTSMVTAPMVTTPTKMSCANAPHTHDGKAVAEHREQHGAHERAEDRAPSARQAGAADDDRREHRERQRCAAVGPDGATNEKSRMPGEARHEARTA